MYNDYPIKPKCYFLSNILYKDIKSSLTLFNVRVQFCSITFFEKIGLISKFLTFKVTQTIQLNNSKILIIAVCIQPSKVDQNWQND